MATAQSALDQGLGIKDLEEIKKIFSHIQHGGERQEFKRARKTTPAGWRSWREDYKVRNVHLGSCRKLFKAETI